jgi:hypothetical protein
MCGIVGIAALRGAPAPNLQQLRAMCQTIVHRGPDDEGIHIEGGVGFGMRRLSIIDLSGGKQLIFNEDRTITRNSAVIIISPSGAEIAAFCVNASAVSRIVRSKLNNCWRCYLR